MPPVDKVAQSSTDDVVLHLRLEKAIGGDADAISELCAEYRKRIRNYCWKLLNDDEMAENATQDTLINVALAIHGLRKPECFEAWLYKIARRECSKQGEESKRAAAPTPLASTPGGTFDIVAPEPTAEQLALARAGLDAMLDELPDTQRAIVKSRFEYGHNFKAIAAAFNLTENTARQKCFQAIRRLRKIFGRSDPTD